MYDYSVSCNVHKHTHIHLPIHFVLLILNIVLVKIYWNLKFKFQVKKIYIYFNNYYLFIQKTQTITVETEHKSCFRTPISSCIIPFFTTRVITDFTFIV